MSTGETEPEPDPPRHFGALDAFLMLVGTVLVVQSINALYQGSIDEFVGGMMFAACIFVGILPPKWWQRFAD